MDIIHYMIFGKEINLRLDFHIADIQKMKTQKSDFEAFMKQREEASSAFINGDFKPLDQISTHISPASIFGPLGTVVIGADKVNTANASGAVRSSMK